LKENAFFLCPRWILALNHYHFSPGDAEKHRPFSFWRGQTMAFSNKI